MRAYPDYRDSGLPWLGKVPAHWHETKLKRVTRIQTGVTLGKKYDQVPLVERPYLRVANVQNGYLSLKHIKRVAVPLSEARACELRHGDVVVTEGGDIDKLGRGAIWHGEIDGCLHQNHIFAVRPAPDRLSSRFLSLMMESNHGRTYFLRTAKKTTNLASTNRTTLGQFTIFLPPPDEQKAIADFLDANAIAVRHFIRNRRRLIVVLNEQKQAIINRAVTRGLDPNVPLKPSGIDWLGDIPEHWEVRRIRSCLESVTAGLWGDDPTDDNRSDHVICVRVADFDMVNLGISSAKLTLRAIPARARESRMLRPGDIVMEKSGGGDAEPVGRVVAFDLAQPAITSNFISRLRPDSTVVRSRFLLFVLAFLQATRRNVPSIKQTTGIQNLDERAYFSNSLGIPPLDEQDRILDWLDGQVNVFRNAQQKAQREIDLIREYRTRLISDVVTGKLDIRQTAVTPAATMPVKPRRTANVHFRRSVFAAEIVQRLHKEPTFGHVKFEKLIFLCEKRCSVDTGSTYHRQAAGPYDNRALRSIDSQLKKQQWYEARKGDKGYRYVPLAKAGGHSGYFDRYFGNVASRFDEIIDIFRTAKTDQCEIVATLYAAWEDLLDNCNDVTDDQIVEQVLHHWHPSKQKIAEERWRKAIAWMKKNGLTPEKGASHAHN
ncbi:MAG: restriction endonuclease subunit S [Phycisphaerae bacterium]|nr:restriction endonuclease subunit S [Phycisphaerae bacterium]